MCVFGGGATVCVGGGGGWLIFCDNGNRGYVGGHVAKGGVLEGEQITRVSLQGALPKAIEFYSSANLHYFRDATLACWLPNLVGPPWTLKAVIKPRWLPPSR